MRAPISRPTIQHLRHFLTRGGSGLPVVLAVSFVSNLLDGIGIAMFFPLLKVQEWKSDPAAMAESQVARWILRSGIQPQLTTLLGIIVAIFFLKGLFKALEVASKNALIAKVAGQLRQELLNHIFKLRYEVFSSKEKGYFSNLFSSEMFMYSSCFQFFINCLMNAAAVVAYVSFSLALNWEMTVLGLSLAAAVGLALKSVSQMTARLSGRHSRTVSTMSALLFQALSAFKYLKSTQSFQHGGSPIQRRLSQSIDEVQEAQTRLGYVNGLGAALYQPVAVLVFVAMVCWAVMFKGLSVASALLSLAMVYKFSMAISNLMSDWQNFSSTRGSSESLLGALLTLKSGVEAPRTGATVVFSEKISFENVSFRAGDREVLRNISFAIKKNSIVGLVGGSGSGKTTVTDLLTGIFNPSNGNIQIDGHPLPGSDLHAWKNSLGLVSQDTFIFNDTVANNVTLWSESAESPAIRERVWKALALASAKGFVESLPLQLETPIGDGGVQLSGGQRQRIMIARELFKNPQLLILDEATSALDEKTESEFYESLSKLKGKTTIILISHRTSTMRLCDQIYLMDHGSLHEITETVSDVA